MMLLALGMINDIAGLMVVRSSDPDTRKISQAS